MAVVCVGFASCGDDNDDPVPGPVIPASLNYAQPKLTLNMCNGFACDFELGLSTKYFYVGLYRQEYHQRKTEKELIEETVTGDVDDRETYQSTKNGLVWTGCNAGEKLFLVIVPFDGNNQRGVAYTKYITTKTSAQQPRATIDDVSIRDSKYHWTATKNTYCDEYYTYFAASNYLMVPYFWAVELNDHVQFAWRLWREMQQNKSDHKTYINDQLWKEMSDSEHDYTTYTANEKFYGAMKNSGESTFATSSIDDYVFICTWATSNGKMSGDLDVFAGSRNSSVNKTFAANSLKASGNNASWNNRGAKAISMDQIQLFSK